MKAKKYIKSESTMVAVKKYFNIKVIASLVASLMLLYAPVALYNYTKENGTLLYNVAEAQITSTVPIVKGNIKTETKVEETSYYSVGNGFEEAEKNGSLNYSGTSTSDSNDNYQSNRPSSTPITNNQQNNNQSSNNQVDNSNNNTNNEVLTDLSFLKGTSISMVEGDSFNPITNLGIVAHDKDGTDITNRVSIDENNVDVNNEGSYYVKASVKLNDGSTLEKVFTIKVNPKKEVTYQVNNFEMVENTAPKLGTARIFFDSKVSDNTISPLKATVNGVEYNINSFGKSGFGGTTRHYIDVNVGDISGEFKLNVEKVEFSNGVSVWPGKQMSIYVMKSEPVVSNFSYTEDKEGKVSTTFDLKDLDDSLSNIKVSLYDEKGILLNEYKMAKKEKYSLDFNLEANGKYTLEVSGDVNLYNDLNRLNQNRIIFSQELNISKIDKSSLEANNIELFMGEELNITNLNIKAFDVDGEDITNNVKVDTSKLDIFTPGEYDIVLSVINKNDVKLEKNIKVKVNEVYDNTTTSDVKLRMRSTDNIYSKNNENLEHNTDTIDKNIYRTVVSAPDSNPAYSSVKLSGVVQDNQGNAPDGQISVELPTNVGFTVDKNGTVLTAGNGVYNVSNKGKNDISIHVTEFVETDPNGITVRSSTDLTNDISSRQRYDRSNISLTLTGDNGNTVDLGQVKSDRQERKLFDIVPAGGTASMTLTGVAGNKQEQSVDDNGVSERFVVKFKVTKN